MPIYRLSAAHEQGLHIGSNRLEAIQFTSGAEFIPFITDAITKAKLEITRQTSGEHEITPTYWVNNTMRYFLRSITADSAILNIITTSSKVVMMGIGPSTQEPTMYQHATRLRIPEEAMFSPIIGPREGGGAYYCHEIVMGGIDNLEMYQQH